MKSKNKMPTTRLLAKIVAFVGMLLIGFLIIYNQQNVTKIGYVRVLEKKNPKILFGMTLEGRLVDSRGNDDLLFKFKTTDAEINKNFTLFPRRFFAWGKNHVAYTSNLKEIIVVDYKTRKEVYRQQLKEGIEYINVNKEKEEFVIATSKALYLLRCQKEHRNGESKQFLLERIAEGKFCWPSISRDSRYIVCGENNSKENPSATSLVLFDLSNNTKKKLLSEKFGNFSVKVVYRIIYSTSISSDNKWIVISTRSPADPPYVWVSAINLESGIVKEFSTNTGLCNSPGCFISNDKYMFAQGEPEYQEFGDYSSIIDPFRSKPVILDLNTGKLEIVNDVPKDSNAYWPIYGNDKAIYFIDRNYQSFVPNKIFDTNIYRLKNKKVELLFQIKGGIVSCDVISK
ncbi:hypothetical protein ELD05_08965 [Caldicellulosiruptor changbaiensis]|uniref:WD40 repeat domain-containing protein n=1 Tax=Caldicellulosiruptor changbaiensis TaxID=1222016 RepID=A0A3T0D6P1_9FIRM|nr:hypothetical protein [Caldicellulosiruptor changbaiensis]AZT90761.1 hypothetical protein ELD05_08965 [Caldicellulosiruptor changbaiensis]